MIKNIRYDTKYKENAINDLDNIYSYICSKLNEPAIAKKIIDSIRKKISMLSEFPLANKLIRKRNKIEYRKFIIKNYIIIYNVNLNEKEVNILHIYNQKQNIKNKKLIQEQNS